MAASHVRNLLLRGGVTGCLIEGSVVWGVSVHKGEAQLALRLLRADARKRPYMYMSVQGVKSKLGEPNPKTWPVRRFDMTLDEIAKSQVFQADGNLRKPAEAALLLATPAGVTKPASLVVHEMRLFEMRYIGDDGKEHRGYDAVVEVGARGGSTHKEMRMWVWDDGRHVSLLGRPRGTWHPMTEHLARGAVP